MSSTVTVEPVTEDEPVNEFAIIVQKAIIANREGLAHCIEICKKHGIPVPDEK